MTTRHTITIDQQMCAATGFCVRVAPVIFELSDTTGTAVARVAVAGPDLRPQAEEAEITCPTGAITLRPTSRQD